MARHRRFLLSHARIVILACIAITTVLFMYDNIFIIAYLNDDNLEENKSMQIETTYHKQKFIINEPQSSDKNYRSIPSLIIIGPPKAGTTSLIVNLAKYFPNWHHQIPQKENGHWYGELRMNIIKVNASYWNIVSNLQQQINMIQTGKRLKISQYPFDQLLTQQIWPHSKIMTKKNEYIATILKHLTHINLTESTHIMEKTPFNYYLPHLALVFLNYFSSTQFNVGLQSQTHQIGTKLLAILRDPTKRLISWHSMKQKFQKRPSMDHFILNSSRNSSVVIDFRTMIINRQNKYDDTLIMLKYMEWIYKMGHERKGPWANVWLSEDMLMCGMEYPVLLFWIYAYKQMGLQQHFKVIGFNYMATHFKQVMEWIRCWVEDGITDEMVCGKLVKNKYIDSNQSIVLDHMNKYAQRKSDAVLEYMNWFYKPIKRKTSMLVKETGVILGVWDETDVWTSW